MGLLNLYILNTVNVSNLDMLRCNQVHLIWGKATGEVYVKLLV